MKTLYVSDLDGTLLTSKECVSDYSIARLNDLIGSGMIFTLASARSAGSALRAVKGLDLRIPAILYNGGLIYDYGSGETIACHVFEEAWKEDVCRVLTEFRIPAVVFSAIPGKERIVWAEGRETEGIRRYLYRRRGDDRLLPAHSKEEFFGGAVFYVKCIGPREQLERAWDILKYDPRFVCIFHQETYQTDYWMEIFPRAANKANGVRFLRGYLGCDRVICFGDTSNDSDMFDICEEKYAVMNADAWLKEKATGVIGYAEEDGVAKFLDATFRR